ncbi:MAG: hypothetical protein ABSC93_32235 [Bryobacteraceae bacterium]|jgi:squalene-hopene/tetraprenyl-beta-curcumene cyclase
MRMVGFLCAFSLATVALRAGWNPRLAAQYLDKRQQEWAGWPPAKAVTGGTCFSCHTGATYLLARPAVRKVLGESRPTPYEKALVDGLRARTGVLDARKIKSGFAAEPVASEALGVESVYAALFLARAADTSGTTLESGAAKAFDRLWTLQLREGPARGAWPWLSLDLNPYEMPDSQFYGAAMAALAVGNAPAGYRQEPNVRKSVAALNAYLARARDAQPLHNRIVLLWAATRLPDAMPEAARRSTIEEIWQTQQADGGWSLDSLGPWHPREGAPVSKGSNCYATGLVASVLEALPETREVDAADARLARAEAWLESHQDRQAGYWAAESMNKQYPPGSIEASFMRDAATAFAALALSEAAGRTAK